MTAIIMVMLWLYFCMNLLLYGAEVNAYFEKEFRKAQESVREMLSREREREEKKGAAITGELYKPADYEKSGTFPSFLFAKRVSLCRSLQEKRIPYQVNHYWRSMCAE